MKRAIATPPGEPTKYIDLTPEEVEQRQAEESAPPPAPPLTEQLNADFKNLPAEARAQFYTAKAAVKLALEEGDTEAAELIIAGAAVPEELKPVKEAMLEKFKGG